MQRHQPKEVKLCMTKQYTSSLTDAQWQIIEKKLPEQMVSRSRKWSLKLIFDAIHQVWGL